MNDRLVAAALFAASLAVFLASRQHQLTDARHAMLVSEHVLAKRDFAFDAYFPRPVAERQWHFGRRDGRLRYWYPAGGPILAIPFAAALRAAGLSCITEDGRFDERRERLQQRILASLLMAALVALTYFTSRLLLPPAWGVGIALSVAFSTQVWTTASRCLWSDTWGLLLLAGALHVVLAHATGKGRLRPVLVATLLSWAYFARPTYCTAAIAVAAWTWLSDRRAFAWLAATGAAWFVAFSAFHLALLGSVIPEYYNRYRFTPAVVPHGLAAILLSPSRGLLPTIPALAALAWVFFRLRRDLRPRDVARLAVAGIGLHVALMSAWECWWGGPSMLSRLTAGTVPFVALAAIVAADAWRTHAGALRAAERRAMAAATAVLLGAGVFVHAACALSPHPWAWNTHPVDVDEDPSRAWDPRQSQFMAAFFPHRGPGVPRLRRDAEAAIEAGRPEVAIAILDEGLALYPRSLNMHLTRGVARHAVGDHDGELRDFERAVSLNPLLPEPYFNRAIAREEAGDAAGALADFTICVERDPTFSRAFQRRAALRMKSRDARGALADLDSYCELWPHAADGYAERALVRFVLRDAAGALSDFDRAVATDPSFAGAYAGRGSIRESLGDLRGAADDYAAFLKHAPPSAPGRATIVERLEAVRARLGQ